MVIVMTADFLGNPLRSISQRTYTDHLYSFVRAAITKYHHRLDGLNNRNLLSHSSGGQKSKIKVSVNLVSPEASFFSLQVVTFSLCPHMVFP